MALITGLLVITALAIGLGMAIAWMAYAWGVVGGPMPHNDKSWHDHEPEHAAEHVVKTIGLRLAGLAIGSLIVICLWQQATIGTLRHELNEERQESVRWRRARWLDEQGAPRREAVAP